MLSSTREMRLLEGKWRKWDTGLQQSLLTLTQEAWASGQKVAPSQLIQECEQAGFWKLVARIFVENAASRALHLAVGFREVGVYEKHGQLEGIWHWEV